MSVLPEVRAARVVLLPCSPHFSRTVAPTDRRAMLVIWQRTSCSVTSLEPTVNVAPVSETPDCARLPLLTLSVVFDELKHAPARAASKARATATRSRLPGISRMKVSPRGVGHVLQATYRPRG